MKRAFVFTILLILTRFFLFAQNYGSFLDTRDNKLYKTIEIGSQNWMAENLNFETDSFSYCYDYDSLNCNIYGRLYNWEKSKNGCPVGWHLPDTSEWKVMIEYLGGAKKAFNKIAENNVFLNGETNITNPNEINKSTNNSSGFSALPSGQRVNEKFYVLGTIATWWTATEFDLKNAYFTYIENNKIRILGSSKQSRNNKKQEYYSIRCIKD